MLQIILSLIVLLLAVAFLSSWFIGENNSYKEKRISAAEYFGVGLGVGLSLSIFAIIMLIFGIHQYHTLEKIDYQTI
jgi:hypothetical protein